MRRHGLPYHAICLARPPRCWRRRRQASARPRRRNLRAAPGSWRRRRRRRTRMAAAPRVVAVHRRRGRRRRRSLWYSAPLLLQELHDKVLVLLDEVVGEALLGQEVAKVVPPVRIVSFQRGKLGRGLGEAIGGGGSRVRQSWGVSRRLGRRGSRGMPIPSEYASKKAVFGLVRVA